MINDTDNPEFIDPPDDLSRKAPMTAEGVDLTAIEKAEALIANLQDDYLAWAEEDAAQLGRICDMLINTSPDAETTKKEMFRVAHDMKGQGGSFGYDLITVVGDQLCRFIEGIDGAPSRAETEVLRVHVDIIRLILSRRMKGDGGPEGGVLLDGLQQAIRKVSS